MKAQGSRAFDLIIAGGGMVGAALGCLVAALAPEIRVCVLEPRPPDSPPDDKSWALRVSAISRASQAVLGHAGAWSTIAAGRISPYRRMMVWEGDDPGRGLSFGAEDVGESELGHIIENALVQWALARRLEQLPNVVLIPAAVEAVGVEPAQVTVIAGGHGTLAGRLLVGADGAGSPTRSMMGISTRGWSYQQRAIVTTIRTERAHKDTAFQRFLPGGPIAFLPLCDGSISIVWSTPEQDTDALLALDDDAFLEAVSEASGQVLGKVVATGKRAAFPLRAQYATRYTDKRFALIGDAAHAVHPLAGQGVNLGYLDVAVMAEVFLESLSRGQDPGDARCLRKYERWRKGENLAMLAAIDGLGRAYKVGSGPLPYLRKIGVDLLGRTPVAKELFVRRAMGLAGDLPRWAVA